MQNLKPHLKRIIRENSKTKEWEVPQDYFSWGRDPRHAIDNTEKMPSTPSGTRNLSFKGSIIDALNKALKRIKMEPSVLQKFNKQYSSFEETYQLMADESSKQLFAELILMKLVGEKKMRLSSFTKYFVTTYESSSEQILESDDTLEVYKWVLRKVTMNNPSVSIFTTPILLALHNSGRLYRYQKDDVRVEVEPGDIVIDAGVGWGDTTVYLAALAGQKNGGWSYAFDILKEGMDALNEQCKKNSELKNITPVLKALSDKDNETVNISSPAPGAKVVDEKTDSSVQTITIDTFFKEQGLEKVDFIKMDIEGAEVPALEGAAETIKAFKPKLAISVYHKWDDLFIIPRLIHSIRDDYQFYLDCTTGFGGETVLYCK
jgi:FkbM family methyltransferase